MNKSVKKIFIIIGIILCACGGLYLFVNQAVREASKKLREPDDSLLATPSETQLQELTGIGDLLKFGNEFLIENSEEYYFRFIHKLNDDEYSDLFSQCNSYYWRSNKDNTLSFRRGWSKKEYMPIPADMDEELYMEMEVNRVGISFKYKRNPCNETVTKDSLDKFLGVVMPEFTIINYVSPDETTIQFNDSIPEETYKKIEMNGFGYRKCDEEGCVCFIDKGSTSMRIDCQTLIATHHK